MNKPKIYIVKKLLILFVSTALFLSCEGDPGPPGPAGLDGVNILGQIFEVQVDFSAANDFEEVVDFPNSIEVFDTDIVVAYVLTDVVDGVDVWEPLPQTLFFEDGILLYAFDHTQFDIRFFLDGTVVFEDLIPELTQDIVFRVAVLPADDAQAIDLSNMESLMTVLRQSKVIRN